MIAAALGALVGVLVLWNLVGDVPDVVNAFVLTTKSCLADDSCQIPIANATDTKSRRQTYVASVAVIELWPVRFNAMRVRLAAFKSDVDFLLKENDAARRIHSLQNACCDSNDDRGALPFVGKGKSNRNERLVEGFEEPYA